MEAFLARLSGEAARILVAQAAACYGASGLARILGVSRASVHAWLSGRRRPSPRVLVMVVEALSACPGPLRRRAAGILEAEARRLEREAREALEALGVPRLG
ncbi:MAG: helix-turn-helix domain-containing protein [Desulfurococcales archaeon]|nr:helix-turn-helix domain-containing protein [Desulfurococcales archaeon]